MNAKHLALLSAVCAWIVGAVLLLAGFSKIAAFGNFAAYIGSIRPLPPSVAAATLLAVPGIEIAVGLMLLQRTVPTHVHVVSLCLLVGFLLFQVLAAIPSLHLFPGPCPCFGDLAPLSGPAAGITRAALLLVLLYGNLILSRRLRPSTS